MVNGGRKPTKFDVELQRGEHRFEISRIFASGLTIALCIAATAVPLYFMKGIITPLAGKTTRVDVNLALAVTVSLSVVVNGFQAIKGGFRRRELRRLRKRCDDLELALL